MLRIFYTGQNVTFTKNLTEIKGEKCLTCCLFRKKKVFLVLLSLFPFFELEINKLVEFCMSFLMLLQFIIQND